MNIPIRQEIEVLPADPPAPTIMENNFVIISSKGKLSIRRSKLGFTVKETIGFAIINSRGLNKLFK